MKVFRFLFAIVLLVGMSAQASEKLVYELYQINDGKRILLSSGEKTYDPATDVVTHPEERDGKFYGIRKQLAISNGYSIGTLDTLEREVKGFGLWVNHIPEESNPNGFSWEWFNRVAPGEFKKLLGGGRILVNFSGSPSIQEIKRIEFIDTIELEYTEDICCKHKGNSATQVFVIKAGSVLAFPRGGT